MPNLLLKFGGESRKEVERGDLRMGGKRGGHLEYDGDDVEHHEVEEDVELPDHAGVFSGNSLTQIRVRCLHGKSLN